jgi:hypothetical protein
LLSVRILGRVDYSSPFQTSKISISLARRKQLFGIRQRVFDPLPHAADGHGFPGRCEQKEISLVAVLVKT